MQLRYLSEIWLLLETSFTVSLCRSDLLQPDAHSAGGEVIERGSRYKLSTTRCTKMLNTVNIISAKKSKHTKVPFNQTNRLDVKAPLVLF